MRKFILSFFILCLAASPALADHVEGSIGAGLVRTTLARDFSFQKSYRPFAVADLIGHFKLKWLPGKEVEPWVRLTVLGGDLGRTAINTYSGDYGFVWWFNDSIFLSFFHNSTHPVISSSTMTPFRFTVSSVDGFMVGWRFVGKHRHQP